MLVSTMQQYENPTAKRNFKGAGAVPERVLSMKNSGQIRSFGMQQ